MVSVEGVQYRFVDLFKHDFFAATGLYERVGAGGGVRAVLKIQRTYPLWGLFPMKWIGRIIANHEIRIYRKLQGVPGIPAYWGRVGETGFLHEFVPGRELDESLPLTAEFFEDLRQLMENLHTRSVAYVDANKRENILLGDDGKPWLIDFQISFYAPRGAQSWWPRRWWLQRFVAGDWYHFFKHKTRLLPGACSEEDFRRASERGMMHTLHRFVAHPIRFTRRWYLQRYDLTKTR